MAGLLEISVALCMGLGAIATAYAEAMIGTAGAGTVAEKPEMAGTILLWLVIPETILIFSFVIALLMLMGIFGSH